MKVESSGVGKGMKSCPKCGSIYGVRKQVCEDCGYDFDRGHRSQVNPLKGMSKKGTEVQLQVHVPPGGVRLQLVKDARVIGTLRMTCQGLCFSPPKAKKPSDRLLTWEQLRSLMAVGLSNRMEP